MFSVISLTLAAIAAISLIASSVKVTSTFSVLRSARYCLIRAFLGSVSILTKSASERLLSSTLMGKRPWSSGIRSEGFEE